MLILRVGRTRRARAEPPLSEPASGRADWCRNFRAQIGPELGLRGAFRSGAGQGLFAPSVKMHFGEPKCTGGSLRQRGTASQMGRFAQDMDSGAWVDWAGAPGEFWNSIYDELSYIKRLFC